MQISLNTILLEPNRWSREKIPHRPIKQLLPMIKKYGFNEIELWQYHISQFSQNQILNLADFIANLDISCSVLGAYPALHLLGNVTKETHQINRLIQFAKILDVKIFKIFAGNIASQNLNADQKRQAIHHLRLLASQLDSLGILLAIETHENTLCDTLNNTEEVLSSLSLSNNVGCCFQPFMNHNTYEAKNCFDKIFPKIIHIHLQNRKSTKMDCCLLSEGDWIDYNELLPHFYKMGYKGDLSIEFTAKMATPDNPNIPVETVLENAVLDRNYILSLWQ